MADDKKKEARFGLSGQGASSQYGTGAFGRATLDKEIAKNLELQGYLEGQAFKPKDGKMQKGITGGGVKLTKRFKNGGTVKAKEGKWIQSAIKKPGALREQLGVKGKKPIPAKMLDKATKAPGKLGQRARLAKTLKGMK
jgi:hypothetical protein